MPKPTNYSTPEKEVAWNTSRSHARLTTRCYPFTANTSPLPDQSHEGTESRARVLGGRRKERGTTEKASLRPQGPRPEA